MNHHQFDVDEYVSQKKSYKHVENMRVEFNETHTKYRKINAQSKRRWSNVLKRNKVDSLTEAFKKLFISGEVSKDQLKEVGFTYDETKETHKFKRFKSEQPAARPTKRTKRVEPLKPTRVKETKFLNGDHHYTQTEYTIPITERYDDDIIIKEAKQAFDRIPPHDPDDTFVIAAFDRDESWRVFGTPSLKRSEVFDYFVNGPQGLRAQSMQYEESAGCHRLSQGERPLTQ